MNGTRPPLLSVQHLSAAYGRITALWDVSFDVRQGETVALVGSNGILAWIPLGGICAWIVFTRQLKPDTAIPVRGTDMVVHEVL